MPHRAPIVLQRMIDRVQGLLSYIFNFLSSLFCFFVLIEFRFIELLIYLFSEEIAR